MTAPQFSVSLESVPVDALFCDRSPGSSSGMYPPRRSLGAVPNRQRLGNPVRTPPAESFNLSSIWSSMIEVLPQGVILASRSLKPIYWNLKAKKLCESLSDTAATLVELPLVISEVCRRLIRENCSENSTLVMECQTVESQTIRISARWLHPTDIRDNSDSGHSSSRREMQSSVQDEHRQPYILVFLENCSDVLQKELRIEQKKYDLTEREAEIWMLLRQEYTYQEIARMLQISLNTVKTHVKNVYAKRRSFHGQERFWCSE
jgi:DNA-binding CsgD family transcriptional regulator